MQSVGLRIKELRKARGMRQADLAEKVGVSPTAVTNWETSESLPSEKTVVQLAAALGTTIDHLLTGKPPGRAESLFVREQNLRQAEEAGKPVPPPNEEARSLRLRAQEIHDRLARSMTDVADANAELQSIIARLA